MKLNIEGPQESVFVSILILAPANFCSSLDNTLFAVYYACLYKQNMKFTQRFNRSSSQRDNKEHKMMEGERLFEIIYQSALLKLLIVKIGKKKRPKMNAKNSVSVGHKETFNLKFKQEKICLQKKNHKEFNANQRLSTRRFNQQHLLNLWQK